MQIRRVIMHSHQSEAYFSFPVWMANGWWYLDPLPETHHFFVQSNRFCGLYVPILGKPSKTSCYLMSTMIFNFVASIWIVRSRHPVGSSLKIYFVYNKSCSLLYFVRNSHDCTKYPQLFKYSFAILILSNWPISAPYREGYLVFLLVKYETVLVKFTACRMTNHAKI